VSATPTIEEIYTTCAIAGGGPAGMMLGLLLARAGVKAVVLEKHQDFLRDLPRIFANRPSRPLHLSAPRWPAAQLPFPPHGCLPQVASGIDGRRSSTAHKSRYDGPPTSFLPAHTATSPLWVSASLFSAR
jgi:FAD binding domain